MSIEILMPALSPTMTEGNLTRWLVNEGQEVKAGDVIAEIETDKATMEVEAVDEGFVEKLLFKEKKPQIRSIINLTRAYNSWEKGLSNDLKDDLRAIDLKSLPEIFLPIHTNLNHYQVDYKTIIPEQLVGYGRKRSSAHDVIICIDLLNTLILFIPVRWHLNVPIDWFVRSIVGILRDWPNIVHGKCK